MDLDDFEYEQGHSQEIKDTDRDCTKCIDCTKAKILSFGVQAVRKDVPLNVQIYEKQKVLGSLVTYVGLAGGPEHFSSGIWIFQSESIRTHREQLGTDDIHHERSNR